jgi:hypothetical protein
MAGVPDVASILDRVAARNAPTVPVTKGSVQGVVQTAMQGRIVAAQARYEAEIQAAMEDAKMIGQSDIVTVRLAVGEEAYWRRDDEGDIQALFNFMAANGWSPIGS